MSKFGPEVQLVKKGSCVKCSSRAYVCLRYGPQYFCKKHFMELIEKRFKRTIRQFRLFKPGERILVALSSGKDSSLVVYLLNKLFSETNEIIAMHIDLGIKESSPIQRKYAEKLTKNLGVELLRIDIREELGIEIDEVSKAIGHSKENISTTCTFCGTFKRTIMNRVAKRISADKVATGHNLDDELQSIVMNMFDNDIKRFLRCGPLAGVRRIAGFTQRIKPLAEIFESEIRLYDKLAGIEYLALSCPYHGGAKRNAYRAMLNDLELKYPGTKYSLWRFYLKIKPMLLNTFPESIALNKCKRCNEPTSSELCDTCRKLELIKKLTSSHAE